MADGTTKAESHKACSVKQMMVIYTEAKTNGCLHFDAAGMEYNLSLTDPALTHSDIDFSNFMTNV